MQEQAADIAQIANLLKTDPGSVVQRITLQQEQNKVLEKELSKLKQQVASSAGADLLSSVIEINNVKVLSALLQDVEAKELRTMVDELKNQLGTSIVVLGIEAQGKANLIVGVSKDLTNKVKAGELVNFVAQQVGGKGGGRPDMAQAGGTQPENLEQALGSVSQWLQEKL